MSDSDATQSDRQGVVHLEGREWYDRQELADRLNVSLRTIDRRVKRGSVEKKETRNGKVYRTLESDRATQSDTKNVAERHQSDSDRATQSDTKNVAERHPDVALVSLPESSWLDFLDRLDAKNEELKKLQYRVGKLESLEDQLERERVRNAKLVERVEELRKELVAESARRHVAAGRQDLAEERLEDRNARIDELEAEVAELRRKIKENDTSKTSTWSFFSE